jgi:hypothetical protein
VSYIKNEVQQTLNKVAESKRVNTDKTTKVGVSFNQWKYQAERNAHAQQIENVQENLNLFDAIKHQFDEHFDTAITIEVCFNIFLSQLYVL